MKNSAKILLSPVLTLLLLALSVFMSLAAGKGANPPLTTPLIDFTKVIVSGNVKVELVQSGRQRVVMYEDYNRETTAVLQKGDKLYISSAEKQPVTVVVYIKDLQRIDACNQASVTTRGKFYSPVLQVFLKDGATAYVNGDTESLYTVIKDNSELKLKGFSKEHVLVKGKVARLKMNNFAALKTTATSLEGQVLATNYSVVLPKDTIVAKRRVK